MERTTVSLRAQDMDLLEQVKAESDEDDMGTSEAVRRVFDRAREHDELRSRADELRNERDELRNQLAAANQRIDETNELVQYVEQEKELRQDRRRRERMKEEAGLLKRSKWWLVGMPDESRTADSEP